MSLKLIRLQHLKQPYFFSNREPKIFLISLFKKNKKLLLPSTTLLKQPPFETPKTFYCSLSTTQPPPFSPLLVIGPLQ